MSIFQLYLLTRMFEIKDTMCVLVVITGILSAILAIASGVSSTEPKAEEFHAAVKGYFKIALSVFVLSGAVNVVLPSQKDAYVILGGYYATNNEEIKQLPENITAAANAFLKNYTEKAKEEVVKEIKQ